MEDNIKNIRLLDSVWCYLNLLRKSMPPGRTSMTLDETTSVLLSVRESLAKGTKLHGVLSDRESMLNELQKIEYNIRVVEALPPEQAADAILDDLRKDGIL